MGTVDLSLKLEKSSFVDHLGPGYVDSDYAGDLDKCRSTTI